MSSELYGKKWLRPREIAKLGLIKNSTGGDNVESNYNFILKLIKTGKLKARDYSHAEKPYYLVSEDEIKRYHKELS